MTHPIRIGDPVQVHETSEVLTLVCLDNGRAWVRDGAGNHFDYPEEDLHPPVSRKTFEWQTLGKSGVIPDYYWRGEWETNS